MRASFRTGEAGRMKRWIGIVALWAGLLGSAPAQTNGIFADFTTSLGDFTVWLDHERAPRAVAGFVGLATGEGSWADPQGNVWQGRKFYDGSIFHRVLNSVTTNGSVQTNGIAIQGGGFLWRSVATNGVTTTNFSNAGYYMPEAATNGLMHSNGVISMANSGPNTDGSQFFVTATNCPAWNGNNTVFGHVVTGMNVVTSIALVAVQGEYNRPVEDVYLHAVAIRRVGEDAEFFNIASQGVPVVESGPMRHYAAGTNQILEFEIASQTEMTFRESTNLQVWENVEWGLYDGPTYLWTTVVSRAVLGDAYFFHLSRIRYPTPITSPASVRSRTFTFWWNTIPEQKYEAAFASDWWLQGTCSVTVGTNAPMTRSVFIGDSWYRNPYSARLIFQDGFGKEYNYSLWFNPGQATNRFLGQWKWITNNVAFAISGVFAVQ